MQSVPINKRKDQIEIDTKMLITVNSLYVKDLVYCSAPREVVSLCNACSHYALTCSRIRVFQGVLTSSSASRSLARACVYLYEISVSGLTVLQMGYVLCLPRLP